MPFVRYRVSVYRTCALSLLVLWGCGDDAVPPPIGFDASRPDGGTVDGGNVLDGETPNEDGGDPSTDSGTVVPTDCVTTDGDRIVLGSDSRTGARHVAVAAGSAGFVVLYTLNEGGFDDLFARFVPSSDAPSAPITITDNFASERAPALVATSTGFVAGWHDNDGRGFEVVTRALDPMGEPVGAARVVSDSREGHVHDRLALARVGTSVVATFVEEEVLASTRRLQALRLGVDGAVQGSVASITDPPANEPAISARGDGSVVVWARAADGGASVVARPLDADAMASGAVETVSTQANAAGVVSVAQTPAGQLAVVFDVDVAGGGARQEVRFRPLSAATGGAAGLETVVTPGSSRGHSPGIASFAGGYAVAFRATSDTDLEGPTIRLALVTTNGERTALTNLDPTTADGGPVRVAVGNDGAILVTWAEPTGDGGTELVARRLRCGS